jgi:hypothetical protein
MHMYRFLFSFPGRLRLQAVVAEILLGLRMFGCKFMFKECKKDLQISSQRLSLINFCEISRVLLRYFQKI